jgi:tRNA U34 5-carboxymethylaminomethyl modifying GTPase MnmE/TrmE
MPSILVFFFRVSCVTDTIGIRATEMDITMIGLQNAGKTSLLRVLAVSDRILIRTTSVRRDVHCAFAAA